MKVLFLYPANDPSYPIQLGALSAYLKEAGHETRLFAPVMKGWQVPGRVFTDWSQELREFDPDYVAACGYESALTWIQQFFWFAKDRYPKVKTILGGYYPSACPEDAIRLPSVDIICQGEGEGPMLDLVNYPNRDNILGLWRWQGSGSCRYMEKTPVAPLVSDLDTLPWPDRFHDHQRMIDHDSGTVKVMVGRGCYYACTYCYAKQMWAHLPDVSKREYVRLRSPGNVVAELASLGERYRFNEVGFHDDIFWGGHMDWLRDFARMYKADIGKPFYAAARVEMFNDEVFDLLQEAGCHLLLIGVESGDRAFRRKMLKRNMTDEKTRWVCAEARRRGIKIWTFNMVGMLDEPVRSMLATVRFNWSLRPDFAMCSKWYPLRGTEMGDEAHRRGLVDEEKVRRVTSYAWETVLRYPWWKRKLLTVIKYANIFTACRNMYFWTLVKRRILSWWSA